MLFYEFYFIVVISWRYVFSHRFLDYSDHIINNYYYDDSGGNGKAIIYMGQNIPQGFIVDDRVDDFKVSGNKIFVARRPRECVLQVNNITKCFFVDECEFLVDRYK